MTYKDSLFQKLVSINFPTSKYLVAKFVIDRHDGFLGTVAPDNGTGNSFLFMTGAEINGEFNTSAGSISAFDYLGFEDHKFLMDINSISKRKAFVDGADGLAIPYILITNQLWQNPSDGVKHSHQLTYFFMLGAWAFANKVVETFPVSFPADSYSKVYKRPLGPDRGLDVCDMPIKTLDGGPLP